MAKCFKCGRSLVSDEIAVYRKMVDRGASRYLCKTCLAAWFDVPEEKIDKKIEQFRRQGCLLFTARAADPAEAISEGKEETC